MELAVEGYGEVAAAVEAGLVERVAAHVTVGGVASMVLAGGVAFEAREHFGQGGCLGGWWCCGEFPIVLLDQIGDDFLAPVVDRLAGIEIGTAALVVDELGDCAELAAVGNLLSMAKNIDSLGLGLGRAAGESVLVDQFANLYWHAHEGWVVVCHDGVRW